MQTISDKPTCALSQFYDCLICRNVRVIDSWLLLSLPAGGGSAVEGVRRDGGQDQYCAVFVSLGCQYQVTVSFRFPPSNPLPYHGP